MFKKCIVVDAKGHLLGRLASYLAKQLLNGTISSYPQDKELLLSDAKESISPDPSSATKSSSPSSSGKDSSLTPEELSFTTEHPPVSCGEPSEAWSHTKQPEELQQWPDSKFLKECLLHTIQKKER